MRNMYNIKIKKIILFNKNDKLFLEINGIIKNTPYLTIKKYFHMGITKTGKNRKDLKIPKSKYTNNNKRHKRINM